MIARLPILHELFYWSSNSAEISIFWKRALNLSESEILPLTNMTSRLIQKCISLACETMVNHIEELLTKSPFEMEVPYGVISVLDGTFTAMKDTKLPESLVKSSFRYLFSTVVNLLMDLLTENPSYTKLEWSLGVRLRGNLDNLAKWAATKGLEMEFQKANTKVSEAADLVATPRAQLSQICSAVQLRRRYPNLGAGQMAKILARLTDTDIDFVKPIAQELNELASTSISRFGSSLDSSKALKICLSPHEKPQIMSLLLSDEIQSFINIISYKFGPPRIAVEKVTRKKRSRKQKEEKLPIFEGGEEEKISMRIEAQNEKLGLTLTCGLDTMLKKKGVFVRSLTQDGAAEKVGMKIGDKILTVNYKNVESMEYSSAIKIIRDSGKILNLTLARQKDTLSQERLAEFILNDLI
ncbi:unnamed protein product [Oikopleura dioica]|uniref:PDZ domain-containing protein n=1 Tax=Oikopleura dioica TaxID=34765 RepID=E4YJX8_OIKDI|nr:unnamed protein product [Oikopleura dioica]